MSYFPREVFFDFLVFVLTICGRSFDIAADTLWSCWACFGFAAMAAPHLDLRRRRLWARPVNSKGMQVEEEESSLSGFRARSRAPPL